MHLVLERPNRHVIGGVGKSHFLVTAEASSVKEKRRGYKRRGYKRRGYKRRGYKRRGY